MVGVMILLLLLVERAMMVVQTWRMQFEERYNGQCDNYSDVGDAD